METFAPDATREMAGASCLVLAPHPDDEVLGCGGTIAQKIQQGAQVSIAFLTDGRHGLSIPPEEARVVREAEAVRACAALGVSADRLTFLRFEDGRLGEHVREAIHRIRQMMTSLDADELFVPYYREFHADHVAAWQIGNACCRNGMRLFEYPIWYGPWLWHRLRGRARLAAASHLADMIYLMKVSINRVSEIKRRALAAHRSQLRTFESETPWGPRFLGNFLRDYELFFFRKATVSACPPFVAQEEPVPIDDREAIGS